MQRYRSLLSIIVISVTLLAYNMAQAAGDRSFIAMDTVMAIRAPSASEDVIDECESLAHLMEACFSVTIDDSQIARLNRGECVELSPLAQDLLSFALDMCEQTEGRIDISVYPIVKAWGFTNKTYRIPEEDEIKTLLQYVDYRKVALSDTMTLPEGMMIDLGAFAKGYLADEMCRILKENGVNSALINLGGNIYCIGNKENGDSWRVGIQDPRNRDSYFAVCSITDSAIITSGGYERYFEQDGKRYSHIFDPMTGHPVDNGILSVTVIGKSASVCDALSTALTVMGTEQAAEWLETRNDCEVIILTENSVLVTAGLKGSFSLYGDYAGMQIKWIER